MRGLYHSASRTKVHNTKQKKREPRWPKLQNGTITNAFTGIKSDKMQHIALTPKHLVQTSLSCHHTEVAYRGRAGKEMETIQNETKQISPKNLLTEERKAI